MRINNLTLTILLLLFFKSIFSQEKVKDSTKTNKLNEVVVTAQFSPTSEKNSIYKVKVISKKTIEAKAVNNLTELLRQELNINFSYDPAFGAGIEMNGISKENIKILIDGVPLIGRVKGVLNLNQVNLDNIERIEMIEGPVSVFYGTEALGGTVNLITKKTQNKLISGNVSGYYESIESKNINTNIGIKQGKNTFKFGAGYHYFNGLNTNDENIRKLNWPKKRQYNRNFKYLRDIGDFKLRFSSDFSEELVHTVGEIKRRKATDVDYTTTRFDNTLNFQGELKGSGFLEITASYLDYNRFDTSYKYKPSNGTRQLIIDNPNENGNYFNTLFTKAQFANSNNENKFNYVIGVEFESDSGEGNRILNKKQNEQNTSVFTSVNYELIESLEVQPAIRYTNNTSFGNLWSPALNIKYRLNTNNVIRLAYGKGFRAPSLKELYLDWTPTFGPFTYTFSGNKDLKLESSHSINLYYTYKKELKNNSSLYIEPALAYNEITDLIGLSELINFERHYINLNKFKSINSVVNAKYKQEGAQVNLGISYLGRYIEYSEIFNSDGFMFTPSVNASLMYTIKPIKTELNIFYKYSGERQGHYIEKVAGVKELKETTRKGFSNLDISLAKTLFKNKLSISIGAKNIFNITDIETVNQIGEAHVRDIQLWGKSFFIKTRIKF